MDHYDVMTAHHCQTAGRNAAFTAYVIMGIETTIIRWNPQVVAGHTRK